MYAVIFTAKIKQLDDEYSRMAQQLRDLAMAEYGCIEFTSVTQGSEEITISYWENEDQIRHWKKDTQHRIAQERGRSTWYESYRVEVVKLVRRYGSEKRKG
jgi:heme-degrading monooxygenase HmoA